jgi:hypothetical protein
VSSAILQPVQQAGPKNHVAAFPSAFDWDADFFQNKLELVIPGVVEEAMEDIAKFKQFQFTNLLKDKSLRDISWNKNKPKMNEIIDQAMQQGIDFVVLYYFSFREGQGLVNGWGTDFQNPTFKVFLVDVHNQTVFEKKDSDTISMDQLSIELKGMTRQMLQETEFPN